MTPFKQDDGWRHRPYGARASVRSGCGDDGRWSDKVEISRIEGVDPRTALVTPVAANVLYLAQGVSVDELPSDIADLVGPLGPS